MKGFSIRCVLATVVFAFFIARMAEAGTLVATFTPVLVGTDVNLSTNGPLDWVHWGTFTEYASDRKANVTPLISEFTLFGNNPNPADGPFQFSDNTNGYSWYDAAQNTRVLYTTTGVYEFGKNTGFQFTVPADTTQRVVKVYVGTFAARGQFTATLSDNSAPGYSNSSLDNAANGPGAVYAIRYAANSANRFLTIRWIASSLHDNQAGNVTLQAATLAFPSNNNPPVVWINAPTNGENYLSPSDVTIDATALDTDGSITNVAFFEGTNKLSDVTNAPYTFTWSNAPAGNFSLTARASDNSGAVRISKAIEIWGYTNGGSVAPSFAQSPSNVVLSLPGNRDWGHWGLVNSNSFDHRAGVPQQINNFTKIGTNVVRRLTDDRTKWTWTNGTPTASATASSTAVFIFGFTNGYQFDLAAGTNTRTARIYVGLSAARGKFQAALSDLSAPVFTDESLVNVYNSAYREYALTYAAASEGQTLRIRYTSAASYDSAFGNVTWHSATVSPVAPVVAFASPTNGTEYIEQATIPLVPQPYDMDGNIRSVKFLQDTNVLGLVTNPPFSLVWSNVPIGIYPVSLEVTDDDSLTGASAPITVVVITNIPPTVEITSPLEGNAFIGPTNLAIVAETVDPDTPIALVEFFANTTKIGQRTNAPFSMVWSNAIKGFYALRATVMDDHGKSNVSTAVNIIISNGPPLVTLLRPTNSARFFEGMDVPLVASAVDLDGNITLVRFFENTNNLGEFTNAPFGLVWSNAPLGDYTFTAQAVDDDNAVTDSPSNLIHVVTNAPPSVTLTSPTNGEGIITFDVPLTAEASDSDGFVSQVEFFAGTNSLGRATNAPYTLTWSNAPRGHFELTAVARDDWRGVTTSAPVAIIVSNRAPLVTWVSPVQGSYFFEGTNITLVASAVDIDSAITLVEFFAGTHKLGESTSPPYTLTWSNVVVSTYQLRARAKDAEGALATTPPMGITVVTNAPPSVGITAPTNGQAFIRPVDVSVAAVAADSDGWVTLVEFFAGTNKLGEATSPPYTLVWSNAPRGAFELTARARDNWTGNTTSETVAISISNRPPTVALIAPTNGAQYVEPATIQLRASASDLDGTIARIEFFEGTYSLGQLTNAPFVISWTNVLEGQYLLTAWATDNDGAATESSAVNLTVVTNIPPIITLLGPTNGTTFIEGDKISFLATTSDSDGFVELVEFYQGTNKLGEVVPSSTNSVNFVWSNAVAGAYVLTASATDDYGDTRQSAPISIVMFTNTFPSATITAPTNGSSYFAPVNIPISVVGADVDGVVRQLQIRAGGQLLGTSTNSLLNVVWTNAPKGAHSLVALAIDDRGASNSSAVVQLFVSNTPPTIMLSSPTSGTVFIEHDPVTLHALANDVDGSIALVQFFEGTNQLAELTNAPFAFVWTNVTLGTHALTATATDNDGDTNGSSAVGITVVTNQFPQVTIVTPTNGAIYFGPANVAIAANATDADGVIQRISLHADGNLLVAVTNSNTLNFVWTNATKGAHTLQAVAADERGATNTSALVELFVSNTPPTIAFGSPTNGAVFIENDPLTLQAIAGDVDGNVVLAEFFEGTNKLAELTNAPFTFVWTNAALGAHALTVIAADNDGDTNGSAVTVSVVTNQFPQVVITAPTNGAGFFVPAAVSIEVSASDADGTIEHVALYADDSLIAERTNNAMTFVWTNASKGAHSLVAHATDERGATNLSAPVTLFISNTPPVIAFGVPTNGASFIEGDAIMLQALASDVDGNVVLVEFFENTNTLATATNAPFEFAWTNVALGTYSLSASAVDDNGATNLSVPITVSVVTNQYPSVTIMSPTNGQNFVSPANVAIQVDADDADGLVRRVEFFVSTNKVGEVTNAPWSLVWSNVSSGTYTLTAAAIDERGAIGNSEIVEIAVNRAQPVIVLLNPAATLPVFTFTFATQLEWTYRVEYADAVNSTNWQSATNIVGTGNVIFFTDDVSTNTQRFYRVVAE